MIRLTIKNMVCPRCIMAVETILKEMRLTPIEVRLGEVVLQSPLSNGQISELRNKLEDTGFELLDDARQQQIEKIKSIVIEHVHHKQDAKFHFTEEIANGLNKEYSQLSKLFSETEGITIEQFVILQKIEKIKELLVYDEMSLSEIADLLGYSSVAHISGQFKKITGLTPTQFKQQGFSHRKPLDNVKDSTKV